MRLRIALLFVLLLVMTVGPAAHAAQQAFSISPFGFTPGLVSAEYEWAKSPGSTWVAQGGFRSTSAASNAVFGFGTHAYLTHYILDGPYIGAHGIVVTRKAGGEHSTVDSFELIASGRAGIKLSFDAVIFDLAVNFNAPLFTAGGGETTLGASGVTSHFGIGIGYKW